MLEIIQGILSEDIIKYVVAGQAVIAAVIAVSLLIPGDQPEKFLQGLLDILKKVSKK